MKRIFLVEDDKEIAKNLVLLLHTEGFTVTLAATRQKAVALLTGNIFDLALVDISLPDGNGFTVCTEIKQRQNIPVIFLTASGDEASVVTGLNMGADDYITKPFRPRELVARIGTALRKFGRSPSAFEVCGLLVDTTNGIVKKDGKEVFLSALEYRLLLVFVNNPKSVITRDRLLDELWDAAGEFVNNNTLTVYVKTLARKNRERPCQPTDYSDRSWNRGIDWEAAMFRNREIRQFTVLFAAIAAIATIRGFAIHPAAGILALVSAAAYGAVFFVFTKARYKSIAEISNQIDLVLHNADHLYIEESDEGELSILQSEITKMMLRIRVQNDALKKEKKYLADSIADIAHQLRTPLTSANLILTLLKNPLEEKERKTLLRETEELFMQMDWLISSLLKLSRLDAGIVVLQCEQIDVNSLLSAALRPFLISMDLHNIALQMDVPEGIQLMGDSGWLSEAIRNIAKNCIESVGDNGKIEIACEDTPLFTEITIHDSGAGFDKEDLPCLFDRFYRGKNSGATGYGIGLALCRTIIVRQGGTIAARNHPQGGAVFAIRFHK